LNDAEVQFFSRYDGVEQFNKLDMISLGESPAVEIQELAQLLCVVNQAGPGVSM
jgi:hypothetical protein